MRAAWEGPLPDRPEYRVRIEAAAYRSRPVSLLIVGPWSRPTRMQALTRSSAQTVLIGVATLVLVALVIVAIIFARHNVRARRADVRGAWRLALFVMLGDAAVWVLAAHHVPDVSQLVNTFSGYFGSTLMASALLWVIYVALEDIPLTLSLSQWTATTSNVTLAIVLAVTFFGFYAARARQPIFGKIGDMAEG